MGNIGVDGKFFARDGRRFPFRGVTYGTFRPRPEDGARYPDRQQVKQDFAAMREAGFTVVRTYTEPPPDVVDLAADWGLLLLSDVFYPDWRYLVGASRRDIRRVAREAREHVRTTARRFAGSEQLLALSLGTEIPADVLRWIGTRPAAEILDELAEVVREEDPDRLVTYANYPTAEYLPLPALDFLTFNVFLERPQDFRRYLTRLHNLAGDRPLVLGEIGLHAGDGPEGERLQAQMLDTQLEVALERGVAGTCVFSWTDEWWVGDAAVEGWHFGLTREDRSPRPALGVVSRWNERTVADVEFPWPSMSVVVCAYNAEATLDECLEHTCALDYPGLEVIVVDDGSTDATPEVVARHPRARNVRIPHAGLSVARNEGFKAATGEVVAYLDADAYPPPEWPYYVALGFDSPRVGGVGGPNVPPPDDPPAAHRVARAPGGPIHVLVTDDRAEHVPGCNMAFWRKILFDVGGFDPVYGAAGDDVDLCWRVLDRGWEIGFHPGALVWHHRRPGTRAYLRQQRGYGRAEALVEARHPDRFTPLGTARWRGRLYDSFAPGRTAQRIYRGLYGTAAYQSAYHVDAHALDVAHQAGVPLAAGLVATAPLGLLSAPLAMPSLVALAALVTLAVIDVVRAKPPHRMRSDALRFRLGVAAMHMLQPLVRTWGRIRHAPVARRDLVQCVALSGPARDAGGGVLLLPADRPRAEIAAAVVGHLRRAGLRVLTPTGWEDHDARLLGSALVHGDLVTTAYPLGAVQVRVRRRLRWGAVVPALSVSALIWVSSPRAGALVLAVVAAEAGRGLWRTGPRVRRIVRRAATQAAAGSPVAAGR